MSRSVNRRTFIGGSAAAGLGFAFAGAGTLDAFSRPSEGAPAATATGYGPLVPDPNHLLALPQGFSYRVVAQSGQTPTLDGLHPSDPDGMGVFAASGGGSTLVTNHENSGNELYPVPPVTGVTYDPGAIGGTSTIVVDAQGNNLSQYTSLAGTSTNCAGGITPWGTWLTCEETEARAGTGTNQRDHGYVFEVDPTSREANIDKSPVPLEFLGRYAHEAVAIDPSTCQIYLTEDANAPHGLYFRWTPPGGFRGEKGALRRLALSRRGGNAGRLEAMSCFDGSTHVDDLSVATQVGTQYQVRWVNVPDRDASSESVRKQFGSGEVTRSRKLEGQWWGNGGAYFVASFARLSDGSELAHDGQVWHYNPRQRTITLKTIFGVNTTPNADGPFDGPDNITVSAHGGLILAEDGGGIQHLIGVTSTGSAYPLARNENAAGGEFCGPAFSADGRTLFANIQFPGYTLAITGPW
ncbi:MAG TPA: alkaline phosphatase PhoX [Propionibacteriaceae bacterium]